MLHKIDIGSRNVVLRDGKELIRDDYYTIYEYCECFYLIHANAGFFIGTPGTKYLICDQTEITIYDN